MNFRLSPLPHLLVALCSFAIALPSQRGGDADAARQKLEQLRSEKGEGSESEEEHARNAEREKEEWATLTPEQRLERRTRRGASAHCQFVASCRPAKLMPGQSGTLVVAALLKGNAVIPSPAPVEVLRMTSQAPVDLGALTVRPADPGVDAKAYLGQPVYENYAWFEIPVTMRSDAKLGDKHKLTVDLKFDLFDGGSALAVGRFIEQVGTDVEVGLAVDPKVVGRPTAPTNRTEAAPVAAANATAEPVAAGSGSQSTTIEVTTPVNAPKSTKPLVAEPAANNSDRGSLPVASEDGLPLPLLIGGGVFALLVVLLLVLRRK